MFYRQRAFTLKNNTNSSVNAETKLNDIMNKILFRWGYGDKKLSKTIYLNKSLNSYISKINIDKTTLSPTVSINKNEYNTKVNKFLKNRNYLVRLYPKTPITNIAFNYDFTIYMLLGIQLIAMNLNLIDKFTLAYNEFFKYNKVIPIPTKILSVTNLLNATNLLSNYDKYIISRIHYENANSNADKYELIKYYNIFDTEKKNYKHFDSDMSIFNILYIKVKVNDNMYIGCLNLSLHKNIDNIQITVYKTDKYIKTVTNDDTINNTCSIAKNIPITIKMEKYMPIEKIVFVNYQLIDVPSSLNYQRSV